MEERGSAASAVEDAKRRCGALGDQLQHMPKSKLSLSSKTTLCRLINSELTFLHRLSAAFPLTTSPLSLNIGHLEAVVHVLRQPFVTGVSRVCKPIEFSKSCSIYVDVVCSLNGNPVWFIVSGRNPKYISWNGASSEKGKGLRGKIQQVVEAARQSPVTLRPSSIVLFFSNGVSEDIYQKLRCEFDAVDVEMDPLCCEEFDLEDEWTNVVLGRLFPDACAVRIQVEKNSSGLVKDIRETMVGGLISCNKDHEHSNLDLGASLWSLVGVMKCWCCTLDGNVELEVRSQNQLWKDAEAKLDNFDTTAMVAVVSGISNGRTAKLLATPECQLRDRFKGNYDFVIAQKLFKEAFLKKTVKGHFDLMSHFLTQCEPTYCGLASLAMVLNALSVDPGRKWKGNWRWYAKTMLDSPESLEKVKNEGISFDELVCLTRRAAGVRVEAFHTPQSTLVDFRKHVLRCNSCNSSDTCHIISSYHRQLLNQTGSGHFSPIGAYHGERDLVLILDVARYKYPLHWIPLHLLWKAMNTIDKSTGQHRGFMIVARHHQAPMSNESNEASSSESASE